MNARQKAKQLKKENERLKKLLDPHTDSWLITKNHKYTIRPEFLNMKYLMEPFKTEEMIRNDIQRSIGRGLMENGFVYMKKEHNLILNKTELSVRMIACRWPF